MKKHVNKLIIFIKESLIIIQDNMKINCINTFNKINNSKKLRDKDYIKNDINKIENKIDFDYYETKKDDYEL